MTTPKVVLSAAKVMEKSGGPFYPGKARHMALALFSAGLLRGEVKIKLPKRRFFLRGSSPNVKYEVFGWEACREETKRLNPGLGKGGK